MTPLFAKGGKPKPEPGGGTGGPTSVLLDETHTFEVGEPSHVSVFTTDLQAGAVGTASNADVVTAPSGERFLGRFVETRTDAVLTAPVGYSKYALSFTLYIIGSWDGKGKQAQSGTFDANVMEIGYRCGDNPTLTPIFATTFSNQLTVQQDYPLGFGLGGNKAATGSVAKEELNYRSQPDSSYTVPFRSFSDVTYRMTFSGAHSCGSSPISFVWGTSAPLQQSMFDESWGVDEVNIKLGN